MATIQDIQFLLDNGNDISNLFMASNKGDKGSNAIKSQLNLLNKWMGEYRNERHPIEKTKKLNVMLGQYNTINNLIKSQKNIINSQIKELSKTADDFGDDLLKDEVNNYNEIYKKIYNRQDNKQTNNITDIIPGDTETPKQEEVKQDTTPVVDTNKQVKETTIPTTTIPVDTKLHEYKGRELVYDEKDPNKLSGFKSLKTKGVIKIGDKINTKDGEVILTEDNIKKHISDGILGSKKDKVNLIINDKNKKAGDIISEIDSLRSGLKQRGFSDEEIKQYFNN